MRERLHDGGVLVTVNAEKDDVEDWHGGRVHLLFRRAQVYQICGASEAAAQDDVADKLPTRRAPLWFA